MQLVSDAPRLHRRAGARVREFQVSVHRHDHDRPSENPPSVGAITQVRPHIHAVVWMPAPYFEDTWEMASSGALRYCWMAFTEPKRGWAVVLSASFSNEQEKEAEDEEPRP